MSPRNPSRPGRRRAAAAAAQETSALSFSLLLCVSTREIVSALASSLARSKEKQHVAVKSTRQKLKLCLARTAHSTAAGRRIDPPKNEKWSFGEISHRASGPPWAREYTRHPREKLAPSGLGLHAARHRVREAAKRPRLPAGFAFHAPPVTTFRKVFVVDYRVLTRLRCFPSAGRRAKTGHGCYHNPEEPQDTSRSCFVGHSPILRGHLRRTLPRGR